MNLYIADPHLWHFNIIKKENRPFKDLKEMRGEIKRRWNLVVKPEDDVWVLGDVTGGDKVHVDELREYMDSLNGRKHLVLGNHDDLFKVWTWHKAGFSSVHTVVKHKIGNDVIYLAHYPNARELYGLHKFSTLFCGHSHSRSPRVHHNNDGGWTVNLAVELWSYAPVTFEEIFEEIKECHNKWFNNKYKEFNDGN